MATPAKQALIGKIRDHPELPRILKISTLNGKSFSHFLAEDAYLGGRLLELIEGKPYFVPILELCNDEGKPVWGSIVASCENTDRLLAAVEKLPVEVAKKLLKSKNEDGYYLAHFFATHLHSATKFQALLTGNPEFQEIMDLECKENGLGRPMSTKEMLEFTIDLKTEEDKTMN